MKPFILTLGLLAILSRVAYAQEYPDIPFEKLLSKSLQTQMGLQKLTSDERDKIRIQLIEMYLKGVEEGRKQVSSVGSLPRVIESKIDGEFEGWEGETLIKLINGQIWQQSEYHYHYHYAYMPEVVIYRSSMGYKMLVEGVDKPVGVIQLK